MSIIKKNITVDNFIIDIDNNEYPCILIGDKIWMTANLNVSRFNNGDEILEATTDEEWIFAFENGLPAYCQYNNDKINQPDLGKLYNYHAITDCRILAPINSKIPGVEDFNQLINEFGGVWECEKKLKSKDGWSEYEEFDEKDNLTGQLVSGNGSNISGFNGRSGGCRLDDGTFNGIGEEGVWWSSTEGVYMMVFYHVNSATVIADTDAGVGMSVRCYKNYKEKI